MREQQEGTMFYVAMGEKPNEGWWVKIKEQTGMGDILGGVCYRPPDQEEQADEALHRQRGAASHLQALVLMKDLNNPYSCWKDNAAGHKQSRRFMENTDGHFPTQVTEETSSWPG